MPKFEILIEYEAIRRRADDGIDMDDDNGLGCRNSLNFRDTKNLISRLSSPYSN